MMSHLRLAFLLYFVLYNSSGRNQVSASLFDTLKKSISNNFEPGPKDLEHHVLESASAGLDLVHGILSPLTLPARRVVNSRLTWVKPNQIYFILYSKRYRKKWDFFSGNQFTLLSFVPQTILKFKTCKCSVIQKY